MQTPFRTLNPDSEIAPHGDVSFAGAIETGGNPGRYFWLESGETVGLLITQSSGSNKTIVSRLVQYTRDGGINENMGGTNIDTQVVPTASATGLTMTTTEAGYYALTLSCDTGDLSVTISDIYNEGSGAVHGHMCLPQYETVAANTQATLVKGASVLYSNTSSFTNVEGSICAVQIPSENSWDNYTTFAAMNSLQDSAFTAAKNGMYAFLKPTDENDIEFKTNQIIKDGVVMDSKWPIDKPGSFIAMCVQVPNDTGQSGRWTFDFSVEFQTTNIWFSSQAAGGNQEDVDAAYQIVKHIPFAHENPLHFKEIFNGIKKYTPKILDAAVKYSPTIRDTFMAAMPLFANL